MLECNPGYQPCKCGSNVCGTQNHVAFPSTSSLCDRVSVTLDLENKRSPLNFSTDQRPLESMSRSNTPMSSGVMTAPCSAAIDGLDNSRLNLRPRFSLSKRKDVSQFGFSIKTVDALGKVLCQFRLYSAFSALDLAVTVNFHREMPFIWLKASNCRCHQGSQRHL